MRSGRDQDYERLEQEIRGQSYTALLQQLQQTNAFLLRFGDWSDFIGYMRQGTSQDPLKERALLAILKAHTTDRDPRWRAILLVVFWPGLGSIFSRKKHWDADADKRWQNVLWSFLQTVCKLDISRRTDRLVKRIINGTIHRLHDECQRIWKHYEREPPTDPEQFMEMVGGDELDFDAINRRSNQDAEIERLREHADAGCISEVDFLLLVDTRIHGKSAAQYAREIGISSNLARKRRLRAEAAIRRAEEKQEEEI